MKKSTDVRFWSLCMPCSSYGSVVRMVSMRLSIQLALQREADNMNWNRKYSPGENWRIKISMLSEIEKDPALHKYWHKRHFLFHRFDEGIKLDRESWFSVTQEVVAWKYQYNVVLDALCGAGGNTIQFAQTCNRVVAIDIEPNKIAMAKHKATIYGVHEKIEFITGDFFELAPRLKADVVFHSPPWGGPPSAKEYEVESMLRPRPASELMQVARTISPNVELFLHRNTRHDQFTPGLWASSTQEEFSLMSLLGRRVRDLSQDLVHQTALPLVESRDTLGKSD
ncbi:hypothetical protein SFRURICE_002908 [Spodoptera frugiperda]|nr:hypothetical protein SFRURICE_002908 [Spodoptera frugiperda]